MEIDLESLEHALLVLGQLLEDRGYHYEVVAIGGGSLLLLKQIERTTKDLDLVAVIEDGKLVSSYPLPPPLVEAVQEVGIALELGKHWLNGGPTSLLKFGLPAGFMSRAHLRHFKALTVYLADRFDQICFKLFASVDHGPNSKHFSDLIKLEPTVSELEIAKKWCITHDVSEAFESELDKAMESISALIK